MVNGIILASGFSKRLGREKLLEKIGDKYLIEYIINTALHSNLHSVSVVYRDDHVLEVLNSFPEINCIFNDSPSLGQSESIKKAVKYLTNNSAFLFLVGDQPLISIETINRLIDSYERSQADIVVPLYGGVQGNPVLFSNRLSGELLLLNGDEGGRQILRNDKWRKEFVQVADKRESLDVDQVEDLNLIREIFEANSLTKKQK